jgi:transcriptional regulator with XRE-family HTH domain
MINKKNKLLLTRFGKHIKSLREQKGLSLRELSYACNIDNSKISKIEKGQINITVLTVLELAAGLEIPPAELLQFK